MLTIPGAKKKPVFFFFLKANKFCHTDQLVRWTVLSFSKQLKVTDSNLKLPSERKTCLLQTVAAKISPL